MTALMDADIAKVRRALEAAEHHGWWNSKAELEALSRIAARIEELEGALKPFARAAELAGPIREAVSFGPSALDGPLAPLMEHCYRARAALAQEKADG